MQLINTKGDDMPWPLGMSCGKGKGTGSLGGGWEGEWVVCVGGDCEWVVCVWISRRMMKK